MTLHPLHGLLLDYADLAAIFRRSDHSIGKIVRTWMRDAHFPPPLPCDKPKLWSAAAVRRWIDAPDDRARKLALAHPFDGSEPGEVVALWRSRLEARFGRAA